jgi:FAD/FMN-containing dehydrogenase
VMEYDYINFNGLYGMNPWHFFRPKSLEQLRKIIREDNKIRVFGSNHAFNNISICTDTMIDMKNFKSILDIDTRTKTVVVEPGIKIHRLLKEINKYDLTIPILPATSYDSLGGAISTGSHGSNLDIGSLSDLVLGAEIITHDGNILTIDSTSPYLKAIRCSLGCLGVIVSLTLKCEDIFYIRQATVKIPWNTFYQNINIILDKYPYTQINVDQFTDDLQTIVTLREKVSSTNIGSAQDNKFIPGIIKNSDKFFQEQSDKILTAKYTEYYIENEMAVPFNMINEALSYVVNFHRQEKHNLRSGSNILLRFAAPDNTLISMAAGRKTVFISSFFGKESHVSDIYNFFRKLSTNMVERYNARPHYGKIHDLDFRQMKLIYGTDYDKFKRIKNKLDPGNKFTNEYIDKIFMDLKLPER